MKPSAFALSLLLTLTSLAQDTAIKRAMVEQLGQCIEEVYIDPLLAKRMSDSIRLRFSQARYPDSLNLDEFVFQLQEDLQRISHDAHIVVERSSFLDRHPEINLKPYTPRTWKREQKKFRAFLERDRRRSALDWYHYSEISLINDSIGYLSFTDFKTAGDNEHPLRQRRPLEEVLRAFRQVRVLIVDLRSNTGGSLYESARFCSYFRSTADDYFITTEDRWKTYREHRPVDSFYTRVHRMPHVGSLSVPKVYLLTSTVTFSAAELTAYTLKRVHPDVTIVGAPTRGGGNGHYGGSVVGLVRALLPSFRAFDASNGNLTLEAKGIQPDVPVNPDSAFGVALRLCGVPAGAENRKVIYAERRPSPQATVPIRRGSSYAGDYRRALVVWEGGHLSMVYNGFRRVELLMIDDNRFVSTDFPEVNFYRAPGGQTIRIDIRHRDGFLEQFRRVQ